MEHILILAINPGSTSTKCALYRDGEFLCEKSISHTPEELAPYKEIIDQLPLRLTAVKGFLKEENVTAQMLSAVVGRGGVIVPVKSGAYRVNQRMIDRLVYRPLGRHASNLGAILAYEIAQLAGVEAYVYDGVSVDELFDLARVTGDKDISRACRCHILNMRASALKMAEQLGKPYASVNLIVAHLGGGITMSAHRQGRMIDVLLDSEGPLSPERSGRIPSNQLLNYAVEKGIDCKTLSKRLRGQGGLVSHFGTNDARKVEAMVAAGDKHANEVWDAMAYQIGKGIGELYVTLQGKVDCIVITGGLAWSHGLVDRILPWIDYLAPVTVFPGENELEALANGAYRVVIGEESANEYDEETDNWPKNTDE